MAKRYNFETLQPMNELMAIVDDDEKYLDMSNQQVITILKKNDDDLIEQWVNSNRTDFGIYDDKRYQQAGLYCYDQMTKRSIHETMKFVHNNMPNAKELTFFDDWNGIGISTLFFMKQGLKCEFMNNCQVQIDIFERLCQANGYELPHNDINRQKKYDVFMSFEIAEHYKNPEEYLELVLAQTKPGSIFVISHSMNFPAAPGHFLEYTIGGIDYPNKQASREFNKKIKEHFDQVHRGWNGTPLFFKRK